MNEIILEKLTKRSQESQNQNLRLFVRLDLKTKLQILQLQKQLFHKLKNAHSDVDNTILSLSSLVLAVDVVAKELGIVNINALKLRGKSIRKKAKRDRLLGYWAIIRALKLEQNMSFRQIAEYLKKYHKLSVVHSTIYDLWCELEVTKKQGEK
jgi:hypothetical protein